jgi:hypothetical protein
VVVFNEIMYHPLTNEPTMEWVELHNQMAVNVDLSGWSLAGGVEFTFAEGAIIPGRGYLVVAVAPGELAAATGLTNVLGPFAGRLSNSGEKLELRNNNGRLMDSVNYDVEGDWPVGADGAGVSLAKRDEDAATGNAASWTVSAFVGGTPGQRNFPRTALETSTSTPVRIGSTWRFDASGSDLGSEWRQRAYNDSGWTSGAGLFRAGNATLPFGDPQTVPTVFSTGIGTNGTVLAAGSADPHYSVTLSAQGTPPPPPIPATVIQNHPAWLANNAQSSWIGVVNPGTSDVAAGAYNYQTRFTLDGFNPASTVLRMRIGADDQLPNVLLNGVSKGITYSGFTALSGEFTMTEGFVAGTNTLDFLTVNAGSSPNPAGFRVNLSGVADRQFTAPTTLPTTPKTYYFRTTFNLAGEPQFAALRLSTVTADGAVFYVNGAEVLRLNMPGGAVNASTLAVSNVPAPAYSGPFVLPNSALTPGTNLLAVELHQGPGTNNDALFGAELSVVATNILVPPPIAVAFNESGSATNAGFFVELINYGPSDIALGGCVIACRGTVDLDYLLPAQTLAPGQILPLSWAVLGFSPMPGDRLFLYDALRRRVLDGIVAKGEARARWPDGSGRWWVPASLTPGGANDCVFREEVVINEILYHAPSLSPTMGAYTSRTLVSITNGWKYHSLGQNLGTSWRARDFDDTAWPTGDGLFYSTASTLPAPKNTELPLVDTAGGRIITWYFRAPFVFSTQTNSAQLMLHPVVDDGAVYYLNGVEIYRQNMPAGEIVYNTLASASVATPAYSGPFTVTVTNLMAGTNLFAVEVHQFTTNPIAADMAFGVEVSTAEEWNPGLPWRDSAESWLELYNRSTNAVDLTGWRLDGGVDFRFSPGTTLGPGAYLVVAKNLEYMRSNYPGLNLQGPFTNSLSHKSDYLMLKDASNNIADELRYFDSGRWSAYADGGGSSLELMDPWADNARPEAWAASDESGRSAWSNYTYRAVAANVLGPTLWNEFVLGLLDVGECLIDDLHVVEAPDSAPVEMLQNGSFENGLSAWRVLGNHGRSRVETDPDNPSNHILHLISTGPTEHLHNHLETTYANSRSVVNGRTYQVSFRAKWVAGNNRLNTRLYFNRVARTTALPMPLLHGTPGAQNSSSVANLGPIIDSLAHSPVVPQAGEPIRVSLAATDRQGVSSATLRWSANEAGWQSVPLQAVPGSAAPGYTNFFGAIPGQAAGTLVQFYVEAVDGAGARSTFPAGGTNSRALIKIDSGSALMPQLHQVRLWMTPADAALLHAPTNVMSNDRIGLTVVYDDREVFYDVGVHLQRSERGRSDPGSAGFTVRFDPEKPFRGVQNSFSIDRSGGQSGLGGRHDEILLWHAVNHAGGIPGLDCDLVQLFAPSAAQDGTGMLRMSDFDGDYFENQFSNAGDGSRYKLELIYYPTTTLTGDPQAPKLPQPDEVINVDFQDWGNDQENYRWIFRQENLADIDDYSRVIALNKAFSVSGTNQLAQLRQVMDVEEWSRTLAFKTFTGDVDTYTAGLNHNWKIYFRPDDGRVLGLLWDMDYSYVQAVDAGFPGGGSPNTYRLLTAPDVYRRYYNHLLDLLTTTINTAHLQPWASHYAGLVGQDWSGIVSYLQRRADFIRSKMPLTTAFAITSNGGNNFATTNDYAALSGTAPLTAYTIEVNGIAYPIVWTSLTNWTLNVPLGDYINVLALQARDNYGSLIPNGVDSITVTNLGVPAPRPVVINEWMADNAGPGGFADPLDGRYQDWFELYNPNNTAADISGYYLTDLLSQPGKWQIPANTVIPPHGFLLVWADGDTLQNGAGTNGDLHAGFQLSLGGEAIGLFSRDLVPQHQVTFGPQTQNVSQGLFPDGATNSLYSMRHWTPRTANQLGAPPAPQLGSATLQPDGSVSFLCTVLSGRTYRAEYSDNLEASTWTALGPNQTATGNSLVITDSIGSSAWRFYRLLLLQ